MATSPPSLKFLCSYGGKIVPCYPHGNLRYHGGHTRVLAVHRSISFAELLVKMGELCGTSFSLRFQLPVKDLDALISITCDEELSNLIEEYDRVDSPPARKIRTFLLFPKTASPPPPIKNFRQISRNRYCDCRLSPADRCTPRHLIPCFATNQSEKVAYYDAYETPRQSYI